jgi:hypothetical protein
MSGQTQRPDSGRRLRRQRRDEQLLPPARGGEVFDWQAGELVVGQRSKMRRAPTADDARAREDLKNAHDYRSTDYHARH